MDKAGPSVLAASFQGVNGADGMGVKWILGATKPTSKGFRGFQQGLQIVAAVAEPLGGLSWPALHSC